MKKKYIIKKKTIPIYILVAPVPYGGDYTVRPPLVARASHPSSPVTWYCHISITLYTHIYANRDSVFYFSLSCMSPYVIVKLKTARIHFPVVGFFFSVFLLPVCIFISLLSSSPLFLFLPCTWKIGERNILMLKHNQNCPNRIVIYFFLT